MTPSRRPDVLVIGGGAVGAASALELARDGARVTLVERGRTLAAGCSYGNAGLLCPSHAAPLATPAALRLGATMLLRHDGPLHIRPRLGVVPWLARFVAACTTARAEAATDLIRRLSLRSLEAHAALAAEGLNTGFTRRGILNVYETQAGLEAGRAMAADHARYVGTGRVLTGAEARATEPALVGPTVGGILYEDEAHCEPHRFVVALGDAAAAAGADMRLATEVLGLRRNDGRVIEVETTAGPLRPGEIVLAAGAWSGRLARDLRLFLPMEGGKGYHIELEWQGDLPRIPLFLQEAHVIATPLPGRLRLAGTLELSGLDERVDRDRVQAIMSAARRALGFGDARVIGVWRGLRPCTPDGLPVVGRPDRLRNLILATGHAMMGLTLAPLTGRHVADLAAGREPDDLPAAFHPDRFRPLLDHLPLRVRG